VEVQGLGCGGGGSGFKVQGGDESSGFRVHAYVRGIWASGLGFGVWGSRFAV
jgi:hypothetical protein